MCARIGFDLPGKGPWYVRVRRLSEDSNGTTSLNATYWSSFTIIEDYQLIYPDSALLGLVGRCFVLWLLVDPDRDGRLGGDRDPGADQL